jgi:hypothetical protein
MSFPATIFIAVLTITAVLVAVLLISVGPGANHDRPVRGPIQGGTLKHAALKCPHQNQRHVNRTSLADFAVLGGARVDAAS